MDIIDLIRKRGHRAEAHDIELTPDIAQQLLNSQVRFQRPLRITRVDRYQKMIRDGDWPYTGQGLILSKEGELLNGGHTCTAVVREGKSIPRILVVVNVDKNVFNHLDDVGARSSADNLPPGVGNRNATAAVLSLLWMEERNRPPTSGKMPTCEAHRMYRRYPGVSESLTATCSFAGNKGIGVPHSLVAYCHFRSISHDAEKAKEFYERLADGVMLAPTSPVYLLRKRVATQAKTKTHLTRDYILALFIKAWSKYPEPMKVLGWWEGEPFPVWPGEPLKEPLRPMQRRTRA